MTMTTAFRLLAFFLCCGNVLAFRSIKADGGKAVFARGGYTKMRTQSQPSSSPTQSTSTRLQASVQYKNVEQMLDNFRDEPVLIAFTAINCGPCKLQRKELQSVQRDLLSQRGLTMVSIDTDRWPKVGSKFQVGKLPCLVAVQDGEVLLRMEGLKTAEEIASNVRSILSMNQ
mmetsp:Transcript_5406/g.11472  ORF Transcript_5406/g.11472 Transcript_5406/m.11472 type:complete len:172 (-) Transcript_5406:337-852(-)